MGKKILIGITILLISGLLAGWYFFAREAKFFGTSAFQAIPENASVIVRVHHVGNYTARSLDNPIWQAFANSPGVNSMFQQLVLVDSLFKAFPEAKNSFNDKDLTIMFGGRNDRFWNLCFVELSSLTEKRALSELVENYFTRKGATKEKISEGRAELFVYSWKHGEQLQNYCITFYRGLFIAGADREMVAMAVKRLVTPFVQDNSFFKRANKTATDNVDLNIYLNHSKLLQITSHLFSEAFWQRLTGSSPLAEWSEIDMTQKNDELLLNGFSFISDSLNNYLEIFLHQKPDSFKLAEVFPAETSFFLSYTISDNARFFHDYESLLDRKKTLGEYKNSLNEINSLYGVDIQKNIIDNLDGEAAMVFTRPDLAMPRENKFLVLRTRSGSKMEEEMVPLTKLSGISGKRVLSGNSSVYRIDKETTFRIYKTPIYDFGKRVFGEVFSDVVTNYFVIYDNCLIMGASYESLTQFIRANVLQETLGHNQIYREFTSGLSKRLNLYLWSSPGRALPFFKETFNTGLYQNVEKQLTEVQKIESVGWQIGVENGMFYNMARLKYNPEVHESPTSVVWKSHLGNQVIIRPQFVMNPSDKLRPEMVVQDSDYNFSLISNEGRVLWKIKLKGPIRSEIFQLNSSGKLHYFFNTDEAFHLIDHQGNYAKNYPLALNSKATNGVWVVDYDRNGDYRFFIACRDHKIYLYDKKGNIVTGWAPTKTEHDVNLPVQFFRVDDKDYIVFADKNRGYILDRKGKTRVVIKGDIAYSHNRFTLEPGNGKRQARLVTTDSKGTIISIGFDGSVKRFSAGTFSPDHFFIYDDFDLDKKRDYIFLDGDSLVAFDQASKQIFRRKFNHSIGLSPEIFTFPDKSRKIGIADTTENRIYLFNSNGSIEKGFPLDGNSRFMLGFSGMPEGQFNLITGTSDGCLSKYLVK